MLPTKISPLRNVGQAKWGPSPQTILRIYKQCVRPTFEYRVISTITVSDTVITKLQKLQNPFIRLALLYLGTYPQDYYMKPRAYHT